MLVNLNGFWLFKITFYTACSIQQPVCLCRRHVIFEKMNSFIGQFFITAIKKNPPINSSIHTVARRRLIQHQMPRLGLEFMRSHPLSLPQAAIKRSSQLWCSAGPNSFAHGKRKTAIARPMNKMLLRHKPNLLDSDCSIALSAIHRPALSFIEDN